MSYELRAEESLGDGVRRVCRRQIALAMEASQSARTERDSPVHRTRKHLKKARAALRLLDGVVARDEFERARKRLRDVARLEARQQRFIPAQSCRARGVNGVLSCGAALVYSRE